MRRKTWLDGSDEPERVEPEKPDFKGLPVPSSVSSDAYTAESARRSTEKFIENIRIEVMKNGLKWVERSIQEAAVDGRYRAFYNFDNRTPRDAISHVVDGLEEMGYTVIVRDGINIEVSWV